jgi:hypothetical protein
MGCDPGLLDARPWVPRGHTPPRRCAHRRLGAGGHDSGPLGAAALNRLTIRATSGHALNPASHAAGAKRIVAAFDADAAGAAQAARVAARAAAQVISYESTAASCRRQGLGGRLGAGRDNET